MPEFDMVSANVVGSRPTQLLDEDGNVVAEHRAPKAYDVEMIQNFLDQLSAELRVRKQLASIAQQTHDSTGDLVVAGWERALANENLAGVLSHFRDKYRTALIPESAINLDSVPEEKQDAVMRMYRSVMIKESEKLLEQLENFSGLFGDALLLAKVPVEFEDGQGRQPQKVYTPQELFLLDYVYTDHNDKQEVAELNEYADLNAELQQLSQEA